MCCTHTITSVKVLFAKCNLTDCLYAVPKVGLLVFAYVSDCWIVFDSK